MTLTEAAAIAHPHGSKCVDCRSMSRMNHFGEAMPERLIYCQRWLMPRAADSGCIWGERREEDAA